MKKKELLKIIGKVKATVRDAKTGKIKRVYKEKLNLIVTVGRAVIAARLANDTTYTGVINYGAVGTDPTAASNSDTTLGSEQFRKTTSSATNSNNVAYLSFFYSADDFDTDVIGTIREFGTFIDGTGSADTGQLFTRIIVSWTKTSTETLTVDITYTIS